MVYDLVKNSLVINWPSLVITIVSLICIRVAYINSHGEPLKFYREFWSLAAIIYMLLLYQMVTRVDLNYMSGVNVVPFREIMRYDIHSQMFYYNVLGNIALFIPFGYIIAAYIKPKKMWSNLLIALIVSTTIEFVQLRIGRSFDIDDIMLNVVGSLIGFLIYIALSAIIRHLPKMFKSDWFNNLICIIITFCIVLYILKILGIAF